MSCLPLYVHLNCNLITHIASLLCSLRRIIKLKGEFIQFWNYYSITILNGTLGNVKSYNGWLKYETFSNPHSDDFNEGRLCSSSKRFSSFHHIYCGWKLSGKQDCVMINHRRRNHGLCRGLFWYHHNGSFFGRWMKYSCLAIVRNRVRS